jgi:hypothetical protein
MYYSFLIFHIFNTQRRAWPAGAVLILSASRRWLGLLSQYIVQVMPQMSQIVLYDKL